MFGINNVSLSLGGAVLQKAATKFKKLVSNNQENKKSSTSGDKYSHSSSTPLPPLERTEIAVKKSNAGNEQRIVAETNISADFNNNYYEKLLQEYHAFNNPSFKGMTFTPTSDKTVATTYKGKQVLIQYKTTEDGNNLTEINFEDGSQISYLTYTKNGKMTINEEEFEIPEGTVVETKSVKGRIFSQLIQTPDMQKNVVNIPEYLKAAEQTLKNFVLQENEKDEAMPTPEYMLNLLGKANNLRTLLNKSKFQVTNSNKLHTDEIDFLQKSIAEGEIPPSSFITGIKEDGRKVITIPSGNYRYEICDSEMRVIDKNGEIKMAARYESRRESNGLWIISYNNGKPAGSSHYAPWDLSKPTSVENYTYNSNNTVTIKTIDAEGNENSMRQMLPKDFCLNIDNEGLKFVSAEMAHIGSVFEDQKPYQNNNLHNGS